MNLCSIFVYLKPNVKVQQAAKSKFQNTCILEFIFGKILVSRY